MCMQWCVLVGGVEEIKFGDSLLGTRLCAKSAESLMQNNHSVVQEMNRKTNAVSQPAAS